MAVVPLVRRDVRLHVMHVMRAMHVMHVMRVMHVMHVIACDRA